MPNQTSKHSFLDEIILKGSRGAKHSKEKNYCTEKEYTRLPRAASRRSPANQIIAGEIFIKSKNNHINRKSTLLSTYQIIFHFDLIIITIIKLS